MAGACRKKRRTGQSSSKGLLEKRGCGCLLYGYNDFIHNRLGEVWIGLLEAAFALALIRRVRELVLGLPGLLAWQLVEGGRFLRRYGLRATPRVAD